MLANSRFLVACNIYISAGRNPRHQDMLLCLLGETQEECRLVNSRENSHRNNMSSRWPATLDRRVTLVHAFRDGPYDRSSFHLAGSPDLVAEVGSSLAVRAVRAMLGSQTRDFHMIEQGKSKSVGKCHPNVGFVDHVSVLPLCENRESNCEGESKSNHNKDNNGDYGKVEDIASIAGSVAKIIGKQLSSSGADVLYYGHAHPMGKELAAVRRDSTLFFKNNNKHNKTVFPENGGDQEKRANSSSHDPAVNIAGQATVGAPRRFVENYNIRLEPGISRRMARTLTDAVRERGGRGLPFVEALTLAYGHDQYEVACNLLDPSVTSVRDVEKRMKDWERQQQSAPGGLVDTAYRVGTTADMCLTAMIDVSTEEGEIAHNKQVQEYFSEAI